MKKIQMTLLLAFLMILGIGQANAQTAACYGEQVCFTLIARGDIQWQSSADNITWVDEPGATQDTFCVTAVSGMYYRAAVTEGTCDTLYSDVNQLIVGAQIFVDAGDDQVSCLGSTVTLGGAPSASGGSAPYSYLWTPNTGLSEDTVSNPMLTLAGAMSYILAVTDSMGCMGYDTVMVDTSGFAPSDSITFNYTGLIDTFIVPPCVSTLYVQAWGAQGGSNIGGKGAYLSGDFAVNAGDTILILVGQQGLQNYGYGGGGGSFVVGMDTIPLVIAGGGGGAEHNLSFPGFDAVLTTSGMNVNNGTGGINGGGGSLGDPNTSGCGWPGGGGGGLLGDGGPVNNGGGLAFIHGGTGASDPTGNCVIAGLGGFGGGGSGGNAGGGGGGYSGGAGGANVGLTVDRGGGGGGSINNGTNQVNTAGVRTGNGLIKINW